MSRPPANHSHRHGAPGDRLGGAPRHLLDAVAFWQFTTFLLLLLMVWVNEIFDLQARVYGTDPSPPNYFRAAFISACVIAAAIITVGNTYLKQKKILAGLVTVCAKCHKVEIDGNIWHDIESCISDYSHLAISHGFCQDCHADEVSHLDNEPRVSDAR